MSDYQSCYGHRPYGSQSPPPPADYLPAAPPPPPGPPAPPHSPPPHTINRFAIAALVLGITTPCSSGLLSVIFGIIALRQIKRRGQRGRGLAIGGLVSVGVWAMVITAAIVVGVVVTIAGEAKRDSSGQITSAGRVSTEDLRPGDCIEKVDDMLDEHSVLNLPGVPCHEPHEAEAYAVVGVPDGDDWPGERTMIMWGDDGCEDALEMLAPAASDDPSVYYSYFYPSADTWAEGDRQIVCLAYFTDGPRTGSMRG